MNYYIYSHLYSNYNLHVNFTSLENIVIKDPIRTLNDIMIGPFIEYLNTLNEKDKLTLVLQVSEILFFLLYLFISFDNVK